MSINIFFFSGVRKYDLPVTNAFLNGRGVAVGGLDIVTPPTEEEAPWSSFPHDIEDENNIERQVLVTV